MENFWEDIGQNLIRYVHTMEKVVEMGECCKIWCSLIHCTSHNEQIFTTELNFDSVQSLVHVFLRKGSVVHTYREREHYNWTILFYFVCWYSLMELQSTLSRTQRHVFGLSHKTKPEACLCYQQLVPSAFILLFHLVIVFLLLLVESIQAHKIGLTVLL